MSISTRSTFVLFIFFNIKAILRLISSFIVQIKGSGLKAVRGWHYKIAELIIKIIQQYYLRIGYSNMKRQIKRSIKKVQIN